MLQSAHFQFLEDIKNNNNREWFHDHKDEFSKIQAQVKQFFVEIYDELGKTDSLEAIKHYRIYRDVRFSNDKTPYNHHLSVSFSRTKPLLRGGYYLHISPESIFTGGGFWEPNPADLQRIRKEFELDDAEIRKIIADKNFIKHFKNLQGDEVKTAPKGFDKNHPAIDLIKKKQFIVSEQFTLEEALSGNFKEKVVDSFRAMRPFFDYMSDVLSTDTNGNPIY